MWRLDRDGAVSITQINTASHHVNSEAFSREAAIKFVTHIVVAEAQKPHMPASLPAVLGMDMAGTIEEVAPGITTFDPGDEIYELRAGSADIEERSPGLLPPMPACSRKPGNLTFLDVTALPLAAITACMPVLAAWVT